MSKLNTKNEQWFNNRIVEPNGSQMPWFFYGGDVKNKLLEMQLENDKLQESVDNLVGQIKELNK